MVLRFFFVCRREKAENRGRQTLYVSVSFRETFCLPLIYAILIQAIRVRSQANLNDNDRMRKEGIQWLSRLFTTGIALPDSRT